MKRAPWLDAFRIFKILGELAALDFGCEDSVDSAMLQERGYIGSPFLSVHFKFATSYSLETESRADKTGIDAVEIFVRNADAMMDHRAAEQVASAARRGADNNLAFHFAWRMIELCAIDL